MTNPLLKITPIIPFADIRAEHVRPAVDELLATVESSIDAIVAQQGTRTYENTALALERATEHLEYAMGVVGHLESVATTDALRETYNEVRPRVSELYSRIPLNEGLWKALSELASSEGARGLSAARARFLKKTLDEFRRHGAQLNPEDKRALAETDVELSKITTRFGQNVLDATNAFELLVQDEAKLAGLPPSAVEAARESASAKGYDGYRLTLQAPSLIPALTYLDDSGIREQLWRAYNMRASSGQYDNWSLMEQILELRSKKAKLLGFAHFADLVLEDRMAHDGKKARSFIADLRKRTESYYERENAQLVAFRREQEGDDAPELRPWDVGYYAEKQRKQLYDFDEEALRPYFSVDAVLRGLFETVQRLYGVKIEETGDLPVWDESVRGFHFRDAEGSEAGSFYVDLYPRESKRGGAWMQALLTGIPPEPHVGVFCANVTPPVGDKPALLTHSEVETLFHEFGHLMHHLLSKVTVRSLAGTRVAWDFVELPSQIMENWCWEKDALDVFALHYETGEPIPRELFEKMTRARTYRAANAQMRQLGFAGLDLALHIDWMAGQGDDLPEYTRLILQEHTPARLPDGYAMPASFSHLFAGPVGYAAGYYSYKWAEVLDADAFTRFKEHGVFNPDIGAHFRDAILSMGDSRDPIELYQDFMGREPKLEPLLERQGLI